MKENVQQTLKTDLKSIASEIFLAGLKAVDPKTCVKRNFRLDTGKLRIGESTYDLDQVKSLYVVGFGKASAAMATPVEELLGDRINDGLIITKYGHGVRLNHCRVREAGHPVPDEKGLKATEEMLDLVASATAKDLIVCLISGGGSALTPAPAAGIDFADKQKTTRLLLSCGATIHETNTLRKHLSRIKGGQLCRQANGAAMVSLILSDVVGDDLDIIASGATVPDTSTFSDCIKIVSHYGLLDKIPDSVKRHLDQGCKELVAETPKPGAPEFIRVGNHIVGNLHDALNSAAEKALGLNFNPLVLSSTLQGEAKEVAKVLVSIAGEVRQHDRPLSPPACLLFGGETTVTITGNGKGGRNMELALAAANGLRRVPRTLILSAGTDGTDGPTDAAGAFVNETTILRAAALNLSAHDHLAQNNAYPLFEKLDDLLITGPTRTNVMDLQIVLIDV